jgi:molybdopterin-guanine dinucleotide biosynthesis protein A
VAKAIGVILSGGKSRRFKKDYLENFDKALFEINGIPMILRIYDTLKRIVDEIVVSIESKDKIDKYREYVDVDYFILDKHVFEGPLDGIYSCLNELKAEILLFVPNDMPFITDKLLTIIIDKSLDYGLVSPILPNGLIETSIIGMNKNVLHDYIHLLTEWKRAKIADLHRAVPNVYLVDPVTNNIPPSTFTNINRPEDAEKRVSCYPDGPIEKDIVIDREFSIEDVSRKNMEKIKFSLWNTLYTGDPYNEFKYYLDRGLYMLAAYTLMDSDNIFLIHLGKNIIKSLGIQKN